MRTILGDGNFKQEHLKMKHPEDDVALSDGHGYMVGRDAFAEYQSCVSTAPAPSTKVRSTASLIFRYVF